MKIINYKYLKIFFILIFLINSLLSTAQIDVNKELLKIDKLSTNNLDEALKYTDSILKFNFINKDTIQFEYCKLAFRSHKYDKALSLYKELETKARTDNKNDYLLASYFGIAQTSTLLKKQNNAIEYAHKALKLSKELNDITRQSEALNIFAYIYFSVDDYKKAIYYLKEYVKVQKDKKNIELASGYNNLSECYLKLKKMDSAKYFLTQALPFFIKLNKKERLAMIYNNMGEIDKELNNHVQAIDNFKKAISLNEELFTNNISAYINLADIYAVKSQYNDSQINYKKALNVALKTNNTSKQEEIYHKLLGVALEQNDTKNAKNYLIKRDSLDVINSDFQTKDKAQLIETQFNQQREKDLITQKLVLQKKNNIILYSVISLLFFAGLFLYQKFKNSKLLLNQEKLILEQKVLRAQMNPHFIFNALTSIQNSLLDTDLLKTTTSLARFSKLIRQNFEFTNKSKISLEEDLEALKNYIETQQFRFEDEFDYQINIASDLEVSEIQIPPLLLQPFVENAIEHGLNAKKDKGNLIINIEKKGNYISFDIIDDGIGFINKKNKDHKEHAIDVFLKRLKLRNLKEEQSFTISPGNQDVGTKISFTLKLL